MPSDDVEWGIFRVPFLGIDVLMPVERRQEASRAIFLLPEKTTDALVGVCLRYGACARCLYHSLGELKSTPEIVNIMEQLQ